VRGPVVKTFRPVTRAIHPAKLQHAFITVSFDMKSAASDVQKNPAMAVRSIIALRQVKNHGVLTDDYKVISLLFCNVRGKGLRATKQALDRVRYSFKTKTTWVCYVQ